LGYILKADRQYEELYSQIKRWTYKGKPTKKAKKLQVLEEEMKRGLSVSEMFLRW